MTRNTRSRDPKDKYLSFGLGDNTYAVPALKTREIVGTLETTPIPNVPAFILGVTNLRGRVVTVLDLRAKFGMSATEVDARTCTVIVEVEHGDREVMIGLLVDRVFAVNDVTSDAIEPAPDYGGAVDTTFMKGVHRANDKVTIILDIDRVLALEHLSQIQQMDMEETASGA